MIETVAIEKENRMKKTYCITKLGKEVLQAEYERYIRMIHLSRKIIERGRENDEK
ncbi:putative transcriptional regulator [Metabacillus malikii]|uniref:Transcriptional regulator n=1 Tax=Metabacillus malikii TaxID=1504265 RepID=A0ABT9ZA78_9BACI|nr:putative transcriptional regulator [Metabacillus malikii]